MTKVYDTATDLITFARGSSGTALRRVGYGPELFVSAATSDPSVVDNGDGSYTFSVTGGANASVIVANALTVGNVYRVAFTLSDWTSGNLAVSLQAFANGGRFNANGTYESFVVAASGDDIRLDRSGSTVTGTVSNISVKEVIFDRATDPLVLFNHPDDTPRIEYGSDGSLKGLLIEEQRTNLVTYSEDFSNAAWDKVGTVAIDSTLLTGPDGTLSGRRVLNFDDAAGDRLVELVSITNATLTGSVWVKGEGDNIGKDIQLTAKRAGGTFAGTTVSHTLTADWVRLNATFTQDPTNTGANIVLVNPNNGNEASEVLVYGAQLEEGSFATSYIPTSGSQQTRSADVASIPVTAFGYNQGAGTVVAEAQTNNPASSLPFLWQLDANVSNTRIACTFRSSGGAVRMFIQNGGSTDASLYRGTVLTDTAEVTTAGSWQADDIAFSYDGSAVVADTNGCAIPSVSTLRIGSTNVIGTTALNGHIKSLQYYPRRLTNAQLQELTA